MEIGPILVGFLFLTIGGIYVVIPEKIFLLQAKISKKIYGVDIKPSPKTFKVYKIIGSVFIVIGLATMVGVFGYQ